MFSITVYSRPFTVSHKAGDCRSARPSKTTHLCSLWCRHQCTQLCRDGVTVPSGPAGPQHLQTFTRAAHNPFPVDLKHGRDRHRPSPLCLRAGISSSKEFSPFLIPPNSDRGCSWQELCSPDPVHWLPASPQQQRALPCATAVPWWPCGSQVWGAGGSWLPLYVFPGGIIIRDTLGCEGWAECSEHPQAEQMLLEKLHQAPKAMGVIAMVLGALGRSE